MKKQLSKKKKPPYSITLQLADKTFKGQGESVAEALISMPKPEKIMAKGIVTVANGSLKKQILMYPMRLKRLFYNKHFLVIQAKNLSIGLAAK